MADLGTDIDLGDDLDPMFGLVSGRSALLQSLRRRLFSDKGSLKAIGGDPEYGFNLKSLLNAGFTPVDLQAWKTRIRQQMLADERVQNATVEISNTNTTVRISISLVDKTGPFRLVLTIDALTKNITLLEG